VGETHLSMAGRWPMSLRSAARLSTDDPDAYRSGIMRLLLTSAGIKNASIRDALVGLLAPGAW